jgi:hypothetical protein
MQKAPEPKHLEKQTDSFGTSYLVRDMRDPKHTVEVWCDDDEMVWIKDERNKHVELLCLDISVATDLLGALQLALFSNE